MSDRMRFRVLLALASILPVGAQDQWHNLRTPVIPRLQNGAPDLAAPAPQSPEGHPDLTGIWQANLGSYSLLNLAVDLKAGETQPWAARLFQDRSENYIRDNPFLRCMPGTGPSVTLGTLGMFRVIQTPGIIAMLPEGYWGPASYRTIFTDGRSLPANPSPTWQGYSVGRWEGDSLVVESVGFNDQTWLDLGGHPHSESLQITERFRRRDFGHIDVQVTFRDPTIYARPWTIPATLNLVTDTELIEYVCNENERSVQHLVVTEADRQRFRNKILLPADTLSKYVGRYEASRATGDPFVYTVTLSDEGQLAVQAPGIFAGRFILSAQSETTFTLFSAYLAEMSLEFVKDAEGNVTELVVHFSQGSQRAVKKR